MGMQLWIVGALLVCALVLGRLSVRVSQIERERRLDKRYLEAEAERLGDRCSALRDNYWALCDEVNSAFNALGLEREDGKPATKPTWRKPEAGPPK